jgi:uncharacterized protein (TIRG00374 family)
VARFSRTFLSIYGQEKLMGAWEYYKTAVVMLFVNQVVPSGAMSGNSFFFSRLIKKGLPGGQALSILFYEELTYNIARLVALLLIIFAYGLLYGFQLAPILIWVGALGAIVYSIFIILLMVTGKKSWLLNIRKFLGRWPLIDRALSRYQLTEAALSQEHWVTPFTLLRHHAKELWATLGWQWVIILCDILTVYTLYRGVGAPVPFFIVALGFVLTIAVASVSVFPGALVLFEGGMVLLYSTVGIPVATALTVTLLYRALSFWLPMPIGLVFYRSLTGKAFETP